MSVDITLEPVDDVPSESRICHYDELGEAAKERLPALTEDSSAAVDGTVAEGFRDCDLVKFTEYYEISLH